MRNRDRLPARLTRKIPLKSAPDYFQQTPGGATQCLFEVHRQFFGNAFTQRQHAQCPTACPRYAKLIESQTCVLKKQGLDVSFPEIETTSPEAVAGPARGAWGFCQTGTLPVVENFLCGGDVVALFRNALQHDNRCIALRRELKTLAELDGIRIGVLSDATFGQTGINARLAIEQAGATASYVRLGGCGNIYKALIAGEIDAGPPPLHLRFTGERQYGWNIFGLAFGGANRAGSGFYRFVDYR